MEYNILKQDPVFLRQITAAGPGLVAIINGSDKKILFVNSFFANELGCDNDKVLSEDVYFTDFMEHYQHDRLKHHMLSVKDVYDKSTSYIIYKLKHWTSGEIKSYYVFIAPIKGDADTANDLYKVLIMPDLSQWKMPFTSFDSRELFLEHFQSESFGTFEHLFGADITYWSEGVYEMYEVDKAEKKITREFARGFIHPEDRDKVVASTDNAIKTGEEVDVEFRIIIGTRIKILHCLAKVINDAAGRPVKLIGSVRDVTAQRNIENDLKRKVEELYQSNRELEEFAYVASHDLQEPLRKITTFSSRLMERYKDVLTGEGEMYLARMNASAENMRMLINDLLEFSRITNAEQPFSSIDLNFILRLVKTDLELVIEETGASVQADRLPVIDGIQSYIKQLFLNIISNAIKFRKPGVAPQIHISAAETESQEKIKYRLMLDARYYTITISDNGIGFEKEYEQKIFNVFQRLHGKSEYPGSGIGLAVCKKIVEQHGGVIFAKGQLGQGAIFTIIIPEKKINTLQHES